MQGTGAHQHSPEGCGGGAGGADHPAEGGGDVYHQGKIQGTGAHQHSPEGCGGGAGGADHPAEGVGHVCHQRKVQFTCPTLAVKHVVLLKPGTPSLLDILMF